MTKDKFPPKRSFAEIEHFSARLRELVGIGSEPLFNIILSIENDLSEKLPGFFVEILPRRASVEAHTAFNPARILLREDIYEGAHRNDPRSRFTVAHELGHLSLHWGHQRPRLPTKFQKFARSP